MRVNLSDNPLLRQFAIVKGEQINSDKEIMTPSESLIIVTNPSTELEIGAIPALSITQIRCVIDTAQSAFLIWSQLSSKERSKLMQNWHALILKNIDNLAEILTLEQGKPISEAKGEINYAASFVDWFAHEAKRLSGDLSPCSKPNQQIINRFEPLGVVAAITPWNFPSAMITRKAAAAMAAGCTVVLKPSELTPFSAIALGKLAIDAGIPEGVLNIVTGDADLIGQEFCQNPLVKKISFTGSTRVGKLLYRQCSEDLKKISLELGGNAPFIIMEDADLEHAIDGLIHAKFRNAGQACTCANRVLVHEKIYEEFITKFKEKVQKLKIGDGFDPNSNIGPIINQSALSKLAFLIEDAFKLGAKIEIGGKKINQKFFEPTIITNVSREAQIAKQEIFGPIAAIYKIKDLDDAIEFANQTEYGLGSYFYSSDARKIFIASAKLQYGMVAINECSFATELAPFGGIKHSGFGKEGSKIGIEEFCYLKAIHISY